MILSIGEILADMVGETVDGTLTFKSFCGGAPFNVAVNAKLAGANVGFIGRVGKDVIGRFVTDEAKKANLDSLDIQVDKERNTTLAFVTLTDGERDFAFNRHDTADYNIDINEILSYSSIKQITLSKELSSKEISDFKGNFTVLNASELQIMDLIYCPFSKNCKTCNYTNNSYLKDDEGRVFPIFRYKFKNCRFKVYNMAEIYAKNLDNYNTLYDLTTKSKKFIEEFFSKDNNEDRVKLYRNLTVGNYNKGIKWLKTKRY